MSDFFEPGKLTYPFHGIWYRLEHRPDVGRGYVVWRRGTGDNVELLHLRVERPGNGVATSLLRQMLEALRTDPPFATVFGFTRTSNTSAQGFYAWAGFELSPVRGVYADGSAVLFSARYDDLCRRHLT